MNRFVCISGMTGAGKTFVSDHFIKNGYQFIRFGQAVLDEVKKRGLAPTEQNERTIRENLRKKYGMAAIAILYYPKFKEMLEKGNVVADGLYSWSEYKYLKDKFGDRMKVIAVYAPPKIRYERLAKRILVSSDKDLKNRPSTPDDSKKRDYAEIEKIEKGGPIAMADYTLLNTKDVPYLEAQLREVQIDLDNDLK